LRYRCLLGVALALLIGFGGPAARAQTSAAPSGPIAWYLGAEGGWTSLEQQQDRIPGTPFPQSWKSGFNAGARTGYEYGPWRFEEEFRFQQNGLDRLVKHPTKGERNAYGFLTNLIYDFSLGWPVTPHIGGGIGAIELRESARIPILGIGNFDHGSDWVFGYQAIAGVRYEINRLLAFDLDYRYMATTRPHFRTPPQLVVDNVPRGNLTVSSGYSTHSIVASLSVRFGAPPPAPPAPPPPPILARRVFLVFFDWDKDTITREGMAIIRQAADTWRAGGSVQIQVTGYTDASGSVGYNQRLSERRANNVANAMLRFGVPREQMLVSGRGKNDQRVPTADGVREPQNRRVEIVFP